MSDRNAAGIPDRLLKEMEKSDSVTRKLVELSAAPSREFDDLMAGIVVSPSMNAAIAIDAFTGNLVGHEMAGMVTVAGRVSESARRVQDGDLSILESMLVSQATALQTIFTSYACRAQAQTQQGRLEAYMGMALKAQAQSRATIQAIVDLKYPRQQATFVKQANIAHGPQQVNNGTSSGAEKPSTRAEETQPMQNKLLEDARDGSTHMDIRATPTTSRGDKTMEAMGKVHRAKNRPG